MVKFLKVGKSLIADGLFFLIHCQSLDIENEMILNPKMFKYFYGQKKCVVIHIVRHKEIVLEFYQFMDLDIELCNSWLINNK